MVTDLEYGNLYNVQLTELFGSNTMNVEVVGQTNIENVTKNEEDFNIYDTYFAPLGMGLNTYYTIITKTTKIYICLPIITMDPLEISSDKIFIPESIIDKTKSFKYVKYLNYTLTINDIKKQYVDLDKQKEWISERRNHIIRNLRFLADFHDIDTNVSLVPEEKYIQKEVIEDIENARLNIVNEYHTMTLKNIDENSRKRREINTRIHELDLTRTAYLTKLDEVNEKERKLNLLIERYENLINRL